MSGVDVYRTAPESLKVISEEGPNHPSLGSIYLPLTQAQALLGALLPLEQGFRFVYIFFCILLLLCTYFFENSHTSSFKVLPKSLYRIAFCTSPYFLIFAASHHADLQGFLLLVLIGTMLESFFPEKEKERVEKALSSFTPPYLLYSCVGSLTGLLAGLKPEALIWILYLSLHFLSKHYFYFSGWGKKLKRNILIKSAFFYFTGMSLAFALQFSFAVIFLFPSLDSFYALIDTASYFLNFFLAYNPILELRTFLYEGEEILRPEIFSHYRKQIYAGALLSFFFLPSLLFLYKKKGNSFILKNCKSLKFTEDLVENIIGASLGISLCAFFLLKGVWHPWYLLWLLPALWPYSNYKKEEKRFFPHLSHFLTATIPLFYIPVIQLRLQGTWQRQDFYSFYFLFLIMGILYFFLFQKYTRKPSLQKLEQK